LLINTILPELHHVGLLYTTEDKKLHVDTPRQKKIDSTYKQGRKQNTTYRHIETTTKDSTYKQKQTRKQYTDISHPSILWALQPWLNLGLLKLQT